jgi:hypothetical protein
MHMPQLANHFMHLDLHVCRSALQRQASEEVEKTKREADRKGKERNQMGCGYRENCVAEVAVHVAHMLHRRRRDLRCRHSSRSPCLSQQLIK